VQDERWRARVFKELNKAEVDRTRARAQFEELKKTSAQQVTPHVTPPRSMGRPHGTPSDTDAPSGPIIFQPRLCTPHATTWHLHSTGCVALD
jgi:hypothetical protein